MQSSSDKAALSFVFYTGMGSKEPLINRVTSMWTGRFMHCEIVFVQPGGRNLACGVWQGENVFFRHKTFGKDCWVWRSVMVPQRDLEKVKAFCKKQADKKVPFNKMGLLRCTTPFPRPTDGTCWFCSELCVAALQHIGYFPNEIPSAVTPTYLYELLCGLDSYANASPLVEQRIASKTLRFNFASQSAEKTKRPNSKLFKFSYK